MPATKAPKSRAIISFSFKLSGTSPVLIFLAKPSQMAVLPTPASPISTGLFLVLRDKTCINLLISASRPITGSNFLCLAKAVRFLAYFSITSYFDSGSGSVILSSPRMSAKSLRILSGSRASGWLVKERAFSKTSLARVPVASTPKNRCSIEINSSPIFMASARARSRTWAISWVK